MQDMNRLKGIEDTPSDKVISKVQLENAKLKAKYLRMMNEYVWGDDVLVRDMEKRQQPQTITGHQARGNKICIPPSHF